MNSTQCPRPSPSARCPAGNVTPGAPGRRTQPGAAGPGGASGDPGAPDAPPLSGTVLGTVNEAGGNSVSGPSGPVAGEPGTRSAGVGAAGLLASAGRWGAPGGPSGSF